MFNGRGRESNPPGLRLRSSDICDDRSNPIFKARGRDSNEPGLKFPSSDCCDDLSILLMGRGRLSDTPGLKLRSSDWLDLRSTPFLWRGRPSSDCCDNRSVPFGGRGRPDETFLSVPGLIGDIAGESGEVTGALLSKEKSSRSRPSVGIGGVLTSQGFADGGRGGSGSAGGGTGGGRMSPSSGPDCDCIMLFNCAVAWKSVV